MKELLSDFQLKWAEEKWSELDKKLSKVAVRSSNKIPTFSNTHIHDNVLLKENGICCWVNGFWPGMMWLMYAGTKNKCYLETARNIEKAMDEALKQIDRLGHDTGFMWRLASGPGCDLMKDEMSKTRQRIAAEHLMSRYNPVGEFIRAWNSDRDEEKTTGWTIIDTMMNLPLLYWASKEYDDPRFKFVAMMHADNTMINHIRPDGSVKHIVIHNPETGEILDCRGGQGYSKESVWSRGQAWAIYGFILSYIHTGKQEYLDTAKKAAHYFISAVCDDWLPKLDFRSPDTPILYDSSAGASAACGMLEIARVVPEFEKKLYIDAAMNILMTMEEHWADWSCETDFILGNASGSYKGQHNMNIIFADYYFAEAIYKLNDFKLLFW